MIWLIDWLDDHDWAITTICVIVWISVVVWLT